MSRPSLPVREVSEGRVFTLFQRLLVLLRALDASDDSLPDSYSLPTSELTEADLLALFFFLFSSFGGPGVSCLFVEPDHSSY